jgi:cell division transport system permease protein
MSSFLRALAYAFNEAVASLWRSRRSALLAMLTIAAGLFVLGFFLVVQTNLRRVLDRWSQAAELAVYLKDDATADQRQTVEALMDRSGLTASRVYVSKEDAAARFRQDFPDLAATAAALGRNPFPASIEVRLNPDARATGDAVDQLVATLASSAGVADVRYDRRLLGRLTSAISFVRGIGAIVALMLAVAAALTVSNVVRLTAYARRDEIEIMQLVGAPLTYVRGPFVLEGVLQGGVGALVAILVLWAVFLAGRARYGHYAADALGISGFAFLPAELWLMLLAGGMALGCIGGLVVARSVR